jgi:hypothetical protein
LTVGQRGLGSGGRGRDAGLEARDDRHPGPVVAADRLGGDDVTLRGRIDGKKEIDRFDVESAESRRRNSYYRVGALAEGQGSANDARVRPEVALPEPVAEDGDPFPRRLVFGRSEEPAAHRLNAKHREVLVRYRRHDDLDRVSTAAESQRACGDGSNLGEPGHMVAEVGKRRITGTGPGEGPHHIEMLTVVDPHDPARILHTGGWTEEQGVDHAEHRGVDADSERQRQHDADGEQRGLDQSARRMA